MSVRKILAPLYGGASDAPTLSAAIAVSERREAHLEVCFVRRDAEEAIPYVGLGGAEFKEIKEGVEEEYRRKVETFKKCCE